MSCTSMESYLVLFESIWRPSGGPTVNAGPASWGIWSCSLHRMRLLDKADGVGIVAMYYDLRLKRSQAHVLTAVHVGTVGALVDERHVLLPSCTLLLQGYHMQMVELFAEYDPMGLLPFLRASERYPLEEVRGFRGIQGVQGVQGVRLC